jgi:hypothetical protein
MERRRDRQRVERLRERSAKLKRKRRLRDTERQLHLRAFAAKHDFACFGSGPHSDRWAKGGWNKYGAWISTQYGWRFVPMGPARKGRAHRVTGVAYSWPRIAPAGKSDVWMFT